MLHLVHCNEVFIKLTAFITSDLYICQVFMLDYGFSEIVNTSNLRSILRQYRKQRCFSFRCHIGGLTPAGGMKDWSRTACEFMQDQIVNKKLIIKKQVRNYPRSCTFKGVFQIIQLV